MPGERILTVNVASSSVKLRLVDGADAVAASWALPQREWTTRLGVRRSCSGGLGGGGREVGQRLPKRTLGRAFAVVLALSGVYILAATAAGGPT